MTTDCAIFTFFICQFRIVVSIKHSLSLLVVSIRSFAHLFFFFCSLESHADRQAANVAIMTGRADGTTLLDGEVSVNCGTRISMCEPQDRGVAGAANNGEPTTICRISVDGKASQVEESEEVYFLRCELAQANARIEQLESNRNQLQDKLTLQSQRLLSLGIGNVHHRFEGSNLDETNRMNGLIRRYEHLYSQGNIVHYFCPIE